MTEVIEAALRAWARDQPGKRPSAAEVFTATGFIGSGEGPRDLARSSKKYLAESLKRKA
jgi:hypothetical protein